MKAKYLYITLLVAALSACKKSQPLLKADAVITYTGALAADGCDWVIKLNDNTTYHADNLPTEYQVNSTQNVTITYAITNDVFSCGIAGSGPKVIHLDEIKRR